MEPTRFIDDLNELPHSLGRLAGELDTGLASLDEVAALGARAVSLTGRAPRVLILGMGSSNFAADIVAREAREVGANVVAELASTAALPAPAEDLIVIAVSATGGSVEVLDVVRRYENTGRLVALTNRADSKLEALADITVPQGAGAEVSGIASRSFRHTILTLRALLAALFGPDHAVAERFNGLGDVATKGAAAAQALLDGRDDWLGQATDLLRGDMGTWILAPVERFSSARQSALMMREIPRRSAYASETGDWSHVDLYLTKTQDYRALFYAGSAWDEQALEWMRERGSTWVAVGGELPGAALTVRYPGDEDPRVAQLAEVLVAELVANRWFSE